ncbi:MAG: response regulator receiver protein [Firmicutes bacterium]|nr:response regulator receiver protein [Bacillota bacterium]
MSQNKVLFVDDESNVLSAIKRAVIEEDYITFFAGSGSEALAIMEKNEISVIVTDMRMPVMDGLTLLKIVKEKYPKTVRVVLSGFTQLSQLLATINQGEIFKFITKPWTSEHDLLPGIKQSIDYYNLQVERDTLKENLAKKNEAYQNIFRGMEQKKAQEKEELHNLYKISELLFSLWRKNVTNQVEMVNIVEKIYLTYLDQLPIVVDSRTSSNLISEITTACDERLAIYNTSKIEMKTQGNHAFLVMIFKILMHAVPEEYKKINCKLTQNKQMGEALQLIFDIDLKSNRLSLEVENHLKIACVLLNKIGNFYNMSVSLEYVENELNHICVSWAVSEN